MSTAIDKAITNFEETQTRWQAREAIRRLETRLDGAYQKDLAAARALIEKIHLICGDRRIKHVSVNLDRRHG